MIKAKTIHGIGILVLLLALLIKNEPIGIQFQTCMYQYIYVCIMFTVLLFMLHL